MNREIKFRWFHKKSKKITYWDTVLKECDRLSFLLPCDDWVIMQFTGLKDKNGKEIYEGDILKYLGWEVYIGKQVRPERSMIIKDYILDTWKLRNIFDSSRYNEVEVIGNIYENPELLKGQSNE